MSARAEMFEQVPPKGGPPAGVREPSTPLGRPVDPRVVPARLPSPDPGGPGGSRGRGGSGESEDSDRFGQLAEAGREGITDSLKVVGEFLLNHLADITHIGPVVRLLELGIKLGQWLQSDGVVVSVPVPLGDGVDLEVSAHFTGSDDEYGLPLTACISPSGFLPVGDIEAGGFGLEPGASHEGPVGKSDDLAFGQHPGRVSQPEHRGGFDFDDRPSVDIAGREQADPVCSSEHGGGVLVVQLDLSEARQQGETAAAEKHAAEQRLARLRPRLLAEGVEFVVIYDPAVAKVVWLRVRHNSWPAVAWCIEIEVAPATGRIVNLRAGRNG